MRKTIQVTHTRLAFAAAALLVGVTPVLSQVPSSGPESASSVFDLHIYRDLFSAVETRAVFSDARLVLYWLRFESELAAAQADVGVNPRAAADAIAKAAIPANVDLGQLLSGTNTVGRPNDPLQNPIPAAGGKLVADYLHEGSTTQDPMDTAVVMQIRDGLDIAQRDLRKLILKLAEPDLSWNASRDNYSDAGGCQDGP